MANLLALPDRWRDDYDNSPPMVGWLWDTGAWRMGDGWSLANRGLHLTGPVEPGDVIACGTSIGVGSMKPGSDVTVSIEGIGELSNRYG
mgnify:CR=1 FL=1